MKRKYSALLVEFFDVFAWEYLDLKVFDKSVIQHTIPINPNQKPFQKKPRRTNQKLVRSVEKELNILYKAAIIIPLHFFESISKLVLVQKKLGEIQLCIDFSKLNKV